MPPVRRELVPRPRLRERLNTGLDRKLTLLSAPAGSGKTMLLAEWVSSRQVQTVWLSLDEQDNDQIRFWTYLIAALQTTRADLGQDAQQILQAPRPPSPPAFLTPLLNELADQSEKTVLILDDYHVIFSQAIHDGLSFLLEHQPATLHLVLATRVDPPLPITRLRARGQIAELRIDDLRFTLEETAAFLNDRMDLGLPPDDVAVLESRTEGWIAGLHLAALSMQGRPDAREFIAAFTSSHHFVLEYLTEEVLERQPEPVKRFLLQTSILDRLCGSLCDAITGEENGDSVLAYLYQVNLFIAPLDAEHHWYRYHHLFADLLLKRLKQKLPPEQLDDLLRQASIWHEGNGSLDEAVKYALRARDFERVVGLVEQAASAGALDSRLTSLLRWLQDVPEELVAGRPRLRIYQAWALVVNEQPDLARQILRESFDVLEAMPPSPEKDVLHSHLAALLAVLNMMASALASAYGGEDLEVVFQEAVAARDRALAADQIFLAGHATNGMAMARFYQGRLSEAVGYYWQLVDLGTQGEASQLPLAAVGHIGLASIFLERNDLDAAELHLGKGMQFGQHRVGANTLVSAALTKSRLRQAEGDTEGALEALTEAGTMPQVRESAPAMHRLTRQRVLQSLAMGDLDQAIHLVQRFQHLSGLRSHRGALPASFHESQRILEARIHLVRREPQLALDILEPLYGPAKAAGRLGRIIEIWLLRALAWQALNDQTGALKSLGNSLALAEPERFVRPYLDEGAPMSALLAAFCREPWVPRRQLDYAQELLNAFDSGAPPQRTTAPDPSALLVEPLTRRELQVLRMMDAGLSSPEIADKLVIAVSTARSHIKNIYGKLDVHSRHEAIERAKELHIL